MSVYAATPPFDLEKPEPDAAAMEYHLQALFGGAPEGLIEIAWTDASTHSLRHAQLFEVAAIRNAVARAVKVNAKPDCNVYVGAALRKPGTPLRKRTCDDDFFQARAIHVDWDEPGAYETAFDRLTLDTLAPRLVVVTGCHPSIRAQGWWPWNEPIANPLTYQSILSRFANWFGGDTTVTNPGRVMRLAGSIAWPGKKKGRIRERTSLVDHCGDFPPEEFANTSWGEKCL